jgi:hypothetical protein
LVWGTGTIRLELSAADGGYTLTLTDTIDQVGMVARDAAGWRTCLDVLEVSLDGTRPRSPHGSASGRRIGE